MQRNVTIPVLWDATFVKQHQQEAIERASEARSERDSQIAETLVERVIADKYDRHRVCALSRCRRARRCIGNAPLCWTTPRQPKPAQVQDMIEKAYVLMQQERQAAAIEGRAPRVLQPVKYRKRRRS
jgi:hypothetical protein